MLPIPLTPKCSLQSNQVSAQPQAGTDSTSGLDAESEKRAPSIIESKGSSKFNGRSNCRYSHRYIAWKHQQQEKRTAGLRLSSRSECTAWWLAHPMQQTKTRAVLWIHTIGPYRGYRSVDGWKVGRRLLKESCFRFDT